ncbi:MAG: hypothetical protein L0G70_06010 [Rubrobacter sp.]|nr:hypothetical protein [Rubrobacter sp.]
MIRTMQTRVVWRAVVFGWGAAIVAGIVLNVVFRGANRWVFGAGTLRLEDTAALVTISLISGLLAHSVGGYVAGRGSRSWGGLNGAMVAVLGTAAVIAAVIVVAAIALATAGAVFAGDVAFSVPRGGLGGILIALITLFLTNLLGGYLGGKLGELEVGLVGTSRGSPSGKGR